MSNFDARDSGKCGVKGGASTSFSRCLKHSCITLWTRIFMTFSCSRTSSYLVRVVRNRIKDRNFGNKNMQCSHPHSVQCPARGWIWSSSHWRSRTPAWGWSSSKNNEGIHSKNLSAYLASNTQTGTLFRRFDRENTLSPSLAPVSVVPTGLSDKTRTRHRVPCKRCAVVLQVRSSR